MFSGGIIILANSSKSRAKKLSVRMHPWNLQQGHTLTEDALQCP